MTWVFYAYLGSRTTNHGPTESLITELGSSPCPDMDSDALLSGGKGFGEDTYQEGFLGTRNDSSLCKYRAIMLAFDFTKIYV